MLVLAHNLRAGGGISVGVNIIKKLQEVASQHQYLFIVPQLPEYETISYEDHEVIFFRHKNLVQRFFYDQFKLKRFYQEFNPHVVLGLGNLGMPEIKAKQGVLVQNSWLLGLKAKNRKVPLPQSEFISLANFLELKRCLPYTQIIFLQTETMKRRFMEALNFRGKIKIIPNVVSEAFSDIDSSPPKVFSGFKNKFKLFQLGRYYTHKNFELSVDMFNKFRRELQDAVLFFTIDAKHHSNAEKLLRNINKAHLENNIVNVGPLQQDELSKYYKNCDALFFPSLLESFSATYPEAMKFGLPILTSDLDFAHEICQDAALYFDPYSAESAKNAILKLKNDKVLQDALREKGKARLNDFPKTWDEPVRNIVRELEALCAE
jgi:glycosyltransferase involved in cell wall biosynthesis